MNFTIELEQYRFPVHFSFGQTDKEVRELLKENDIKDKEKWHKMEKKHQAVAINYDGAVLIRFREVPKCPKGFAVVAHECFHAVLMVMKHIGSELTDSSEENFAYSLEYLVAKVLEKLPMLEVSRCTS